MDRSARTRVLAVVLGVAGFVAGCGGSSSGGSAPVAIGGGSTPPVVTTPTDTAAPLFDSDFESVCQGATQSRATAYDKTAATHKAFYFETYQDDLLNQSDTDLPADWTVQYSATDPTAFTAIDLVGCGVRTSSKLLKTCTGYKDNDGNDLGKVELYSAKYTLTVHEATTGKTLSSTTVSSDSADCPTFESFDEGEKVVKEYDNIPKDKVVAALKPFIQP